MSSPWDPAVPQAMQRHGGSNWSLPQAAKPKSPPSETLQDLPAPQIQGALVPEEKAEVPAG